MAIPVKRILLSVGLVLVLAVGIAYIRYFEAIHPTPASFEETRQVVIPFIQVLEPPGEGPWPAALILHGCGGVKPSVRERAEELAGQGYVAIIVDSFTGRGIDWERACDGLVMPGDQRAADVLVGLDYARNHPAVRPDQLFLVGYSHGGWTVLENLAYGAELPRGLIDAPANALRGVRGVVTWYPYCGVVTRFRAGWESDIPVLMLLAGEDEITAPGPCVEVAQRQQSARQPLELHVFAEVTHGFDTTEEWVLVYDPQTHARARQLQFNFLSHHVQ